MNARPYIFGCLCLVGATGTAAASDISLSSLLSVGSGVSSSSFDGGPAPRAGVSNARDANCDEAASMHRGPARPNGAAPTPSPVGDLGDSPHDGGGSVRSSSPSWQSLLPGSML